MPKWASECKVNTQRQINSVITHTHTHTHAHTHTHTHTHTTVEFTNWQNMKISEVISHKNQDVYVKIQRDKWFPRPCQVRH